MACLKPALFFILVVMLQATGCRCEDPTVEILKNKMIALQSLLYQDISLLRGDVDKLSNKLRNVSMILEDSVRGDDHIREQTKQDVGNPNRINDINLFKSRMERAFADEKVYTRQSIGEFMSQITTFRTAASLIDTQLTSDISLLGEEIAKVLSKMLELKSDINKEMKDIISETQNKHYEVKAEMRKFNTELKNVIIELTERQAKGVSELSKKLESRLQTSIDSISSEVTTIRNKCTSEIESLSARNRQQTSALNSAMVVLSDKVSDVKSECAASMDNVNNKLNAIVKNNANRADRAFVNGGIYTQGKARLVNIQQTSSTVGGRLEVFFENKWGTVCDYGFDMKDAAVACRMLGLPGAHSTECCSRMGMGTGEIWLGNLDCRGQEADLFGCDTFGRFRRLSSCRHHDDVSVTCNK